MSATIEGHLPGEMTRREKEARELAAISRLVIEERLSDVVISKRLSIPVHTVRRRRRALGLAAARGA